MDCAPHFEKMLYDNSQLGAGVYSCLAVEGNEFHRTITEEVLNYVDREMRSPHGGFYSTQDADSEGEEGKFFVSTVDEIRDVLGAEADEFIAAYGIKPGGNWEGKNILELTGTPEQRERLADAWAKLFGRRQARVHPGRDEKVLTSWNGLMLAAIAEAAAAFALADDSPERGDPYREIAEENADFLLHYLQTDTDRLFHSCKAAKGRVTEEREGVPKIDGFLEDYANLLDGPRPALARRSACACDFACKGRVTAVDGLREQLGSG